jgi:tRNA splicing ligase
VTGESGAPCRVVLIGMMGSGKSTIGRLLAAKTGWPYYDNDELLAMLSGETAKGLLAHDGVAQLREGSISVCVRSRHASSERPQERSSTTSCAPLSGASHSLSG